MTVIKKILSFVFPLMMIWGILWFVYSAGEDSPDGVVISKKVDEFIQNKILLGNMTSSGPDCSDTRTINLLKKILDENQAVVSDLQNSTYKLTNISTSNKSKNGNTHNCSAIIELQLQDGNNRQLPINYSVIIADSKKTFVVRLDPL